MVCVVCDHCCDYCCIRLQSSGGSELSQCFPHGAIIHMGSPHSLDVQSTTQPPLPTLKNRERSTNKSEQASQYIRGAATLPLEKWLVCAPTVAAAPRTAIVPCVCALGEPAPQYPHRLSVCRTHKNMRTQDWIRLAATNASRSRCLRVNACHSSTAPLVSLCGHALVRAATEGGPVSPGGLTC